MFKLSAALAIAVSALGIHAPAALGAPPGNDLFVNAALVTVGFSESLDTTEATTDADDAQLNTSCGAPATDASVWYAIDGTDTGVVVDVSQSDYSAGVLIGTGTQGNLVTVACGPGAVGFFAAAGTTYYVLVFDDQLDGSGHGGNLNVAFSAIPPPPTLDISVDRFGRFDSKAGTAILSGSYVCTDADFIDVAVAARQSVGRFFISGSGGFSDFGTCDGVPHVWSAEVFPEQGLFKGGRTLTVAFAFSCGPFDCADGFAEQTVQLRGK
jgi:hypothetical protein